MNEETINTEDNPNSETSSGCGCLIIIIIVAIIFFYFKGCDSDESEENNISYVESTVNDYNSQYEDNLNNDNVENEYILNAKKLGIPFVSNFEYMDNIKAFFYISYDNIDDIINSMYYVSPPIYDFFVKMENANQYEFAKALSILSKEMGASVSETEMIKYYYSNMNISEFNESKNEIISNVKQQLFNTVKKSNGSSKFISDNDIVSKFIKEEYLSKDELIQINDNLIKQAKESGNVNVILKAFNIDIYSYEAEKGYKLFFNKDGVEEVIKIYYMNGDWRIAI